MGQLGSAMQNPVTFQKDPQNFSGSEWGARFLGRGTQGLAQGFQNYQNQNSMMRQGGGGGGMLNPVQAQPVDPSYFQPQQRGRNDLNFYGGS